ncbi:hypothetical protein GUJ93_ZPchr0006g45540 [Zizania palustris]|uniref:Uncharacterized protein n=1 Tax=Zizania palustris TaxID=103762 RepID=A0A8J5VPJ9_ZIZPA|nr:hypothetical protein GUJ93_ZPchr0006g45540 [Zizania palustris]
MGSGLSCTHRSSALFLHQPAQVIAADGSLREVAAAAASSSTSPVSVSDVLGGNADRFFLCSSDALYFDVDVPALDGGELLRPGQMYFLLPAAMLGRPLSGVDMAALAVRASDALAARTTRRPRARGRGRARGVKNKKQVRVMPVHAASGCGADVHGDWKLNEKLNERTLGEYSVMTWPCPAASVANNLAASPSPSPQVKRLLSTIEEDAYA